MDVIVIPIHRLLDTVIVIYIWIVIAGTVMTWLVAFNVINTYNRFVYMVNEFLFRVTEPALGPVRRVLPTIAGVDLSPLVLVLLLVLLRNFFDLLVFKLL
jgi:YggT family protein